jgi:hypothetical protein
MGNAACCLLKSGDYDYDEPKRAVVERAHIQVESTNRDDRSSAGPSLVSPSWSSPQLSSFLSTHGGSDAFSGHGLEDIMLHDDDGDDDDDDNTSFLFNVSPEPDPPPPPPSALRPDAHHEVATLITAGDVENLALHVERRRLALDDVVFGNGVRPLHLAVVRNDFLLTLFLLSRGVDVHARDVDGRDAAAWAAQCGHRDMQRLLALHAGSCQSTRQPTRLFAPLEDGGGNSGAAQVTLTRVQNGTTRYKTVQHGTQWYNTVHTGTQRHKQNHTATRTHVYLLYRRVGAASASFIQRIYRAAESLRGQ